MSSFEERRAAREEEARRERRTRVVGASVFAALVIVAVVAFGAVQTFSAGAPDGAGSGSAGREAPAIEGGREVEDSSGSRVTVPDQAQNVAVMDAFSGELSVMIGTGERLCGLPNGAKSDRILQMIYPDLQDSTLSLSGNAVNVEALMAQECDLAIVGAQMADAECEKLAAVGIPYVKVGYTTVDEQIVAIRVIGQAFGGDAAERAEALAGYYEGIVADVEQRVADIPEAERVRVYHSINDALLTDGSESLGVDWITRTGCIDVSAGMEATSDSDFNASIEQIYDWDPDLVICNVAATAREIAEGAQWQGLGAVASGDVRNIPIGATRWGQRGSVETAYAMVWLGQLAYPDRFADVDLRQMVTEGYRDYLGVEVDDALYEQILSGEGIRETGTGSGNGSGSGGGSGNGSGGGSGNGGGGGA